MRQCSKITQRCHILRQTRLFSTYEDYNIKSKHYDDYRKAVGTNVIKSTLKQKTTNYDSDTYQFLDAGCGTGNYIQPLLDMGIKNVIAIDTNEGMLAKCKQKYDKEIKEGNVVLKQASLLEKLPFDDNTIDGICINQVTHHLDDDITRKDNYKNIRALLSEVNRCLKPNGILFINHCTPIQCLYTFWYFMFIPNAAENMCEKVVTKEWFINQLQICGFNDVISHKITETVNKNEYLYDLENVKNEEWRYNDSTWSIVNDNELNYALNKIDELVKSEKSKQFLIQIYKDNIEALGASTTFVAHKPSI